MARNISHGPRLEEQGNAKGSVPRRWFCQCPWCGPVLAPVDPAEDCKHQLEFASEVAHLASQPLLLLTVARSGVTEHAAADELRERAHRLLPEKPTSLIVRHGSARREGAYVLANGRTRPVLRARSGAPQRWRIVNAAKSRFSISTSRGRRSRRSAVTGDYRSIR